MFGMASLSLKKRGFLQNDRLSLQITISTKFWKHVLSTKPKKFKKNIFEKYKKFPKYELYLFTINFLQGLLNFLGRWLKTRFCILSPLLSYLFISDIPDLLKGGGGPCNVGGIRVNV